MNEIFDKLVKSKIEKFFDDYKNLSREVFVDENGKLIHPGEFGIYREKIVKKLIEPFLPAHLAVGSGFIITKQNNVSTQCDLIIYDKWNTPVIESDEQRFFPVECVVGVIEVKSKLTKDDLKKALQKLSRIKSFRRDIELNPYFIHKNYNDKCPIFDTKGCVMNQMATFLICESIDMSFDDESIKALFDNIYKGIDSSLLHNLILSVDNGLFLYYTEKDNKLIYYPYIVYNENFIHHFALPGKFHYDKDHILLFVNYLSSVISNVSILDVDMTHYLKFI